MTESGLSSSALTSSGKVFRLGIDLCPLLRLSHAMRKLHGELTVVLSTATLGVIHGDGFAKTHGLGQQRILSDNGITDIRSKLRAQRMNDVDLAGSLPDKR